MWVAMTMSHTTTESFGWRPRGQADFRWIGLVRRSPVLPLLQTTDVRLGGHRNTPVPNVASTPPYAFRSTGMSSRRRPSHGWPDGQVGDVNRTRRSSSSVRQTDPRHWWLLSSRPWRHKPPWPSSPAEGVRSWKRELRKASDGGEVTMMAPQALLVVGDLGTSSAAIGWVVRAAAEAGSDDAGLVAEEPIVLRRTALRAEATGVGVAHVTDLTYRHIGGSIGDAQMSISRWGVFRLLCALHRDRQGHRGDNRQRYAPTRDRQRRHSSIGMHTPIEYARIHDTQSFARLSQVS